MIGSSAAAAAQYPSNDHHHHNDHIPEIQSGGTSSSSSDEEGSRTRKQSSRRGRAREHSLAIPDDIIDFGHSKAIANASQALYMSPPRNHYHKKILERLGVAVENRRMEGDLLSPTTPATALGGTFSGADTASFSNTIASSSSNDTATIAARRPDDFPAPRDYVYALFTSFEELRMQYLVNSWWKRANYAIVRFTMTIIALSIVSLCCETVTSIRVSSQTALTNIEYFCFAWLAFDFVVRLLCTRTPRWDYMQHPSAIVDFVSILPTIIDLAVPQDVSALRVIRVVRLVRAVRLIRASRSSGLVELLRAMYRSIDALFLLFFLLVIALFIFSSAIYLLDQTAATFNDNMNLWVRSDGTISPFQSIIHTVWFCITTLATVGYGDDVPFALPAKLAAGVLMATGILVIAFPTVVLSAAFHQAYSERFLSMLRSSLTDKQRESLAYGKSRRLFAALNAKRRTLVIPAAITQADGAETTATPASFKGRLFSILHRHTSGDGNGKQTQGSPSGGSSGPSPASTSVTGKAKWAALRSINETIDQQQGNNSENETSVRSDSSNMPAQLSPNNAIVTKRGGPVVDMAKVPSSSPIFAGATATVTTSERNADPLQPKLTAIADVEKRFAPPELAQIKIAFIPFYVDSRSECTSELCDADDERGMVRAAKTKHADRRKSSIAAVDNMSPKNKDKVRSSFAAGGTDVCEASVSVFSNSDVNAGIVSSESETDDGVQPTASFVRQAIPDGEEAERPLGSFSSPEPLLKNQRAPTNVMRKRSRASNNPLRHESGILHKLDRAAEYINVNIHQLKTQVISNRGVVSYPPKLKLLCVGGTTVIDVKVEKCFPPGSYSMTFTVLIDDEDYNRLQTNLAYLTFGADRVRKVEVASISKLVVDIRLGNILLFANHQRKANGIPLQNACDACDADLVSELMNDEERELLDTCYLTTTTYRNVQSSSVDAVLLCPSLAAFKVVQRKIHLLKFSFEVQFRGPQHHRVDLKGLESTYLCLDAPDSIADALRHAAPHVRLSTAAGPQDSSSTPAINVLRGNLMEKENSGKMDPVLGGSADDGGGVATTEVHRFENGDAEANVSVEDV